MSVLVNSETFVKQLKDELSLASESLIIISPYITDAAVRELLPNLKKNKLTMKLITLPPGKEYITGSVEPMALLHLTENGIQVRTLQDLHSKIYIIDDRIAYVGSANFTSSGWRINNYGNIEVMTRTKLLEKDLEWLNKFYITPSRPLNITKKWVEDFNIKIEDLKDSYTEFLEEIDNSIIEVSNDAIISSPYINFLTKLQKQKKIKSFEHIQNGQGKNVFKIDDRYFVKLLLSKSHDGTSKFDENYRFALSKNATIQALNNKVNAFVMLLEESGDYAWIPRKFLEETLLVQKHLDGLKRAWQIQISRQHQNFYIRSKGRKKKVIYSISNYINTIRYNKRADEVKRVNRKILDKK